MNQEAIERVSRPRSGDSAELAEIRAWLAKCVSPAFRALCFDQHGPTPATRVAYLLETLDTLGAELQRSMR